LVINLDYCMKKQVFSIEKIAKISGSKGEPVKILQLLENIFSDVKLYKID